MVKLRTARVKGSQFEMSVRDSLAQKYKDVLLTKQEGFVAQHDIIIHSAKKKIECKFHKGFSWNELKKYFNKLKLKEPLDYEPLLIVKANHQPCLVMFKSFFNDDHIVTEFETFFRIPFIKHKGSRK